MALGLSRAVKDYIGKVPRSNRAETFIDVYYDVDAFADEHCAGRIQPNYRDIIQFFDGFNAVDRNMKMREIGAEGISHLRGRKLTSLTLRPR